MTTPFAPLLPSTVLALTLGLLALPALAQTTGMHGMDHGAPSAVGTEPTPDTMAAAGGGLDAANGAAMERMMQAMDATEPTGDPDADFLRLMIPHHQSAVDMARALLAQSDDAEVAALAQAVIDTQEAEIALMTDMLARLGHPVDQDAAGSR